ncbi:MAG: right-handed parallel beta-helix repeat-containing protein [Anaerolineae bacterium]|nr:right-handed parallel beta-helix repeat-containing protein [Anaerolineae bacterium]
MSRAKWLFPFVLLAFIAGFVIARVLPSGVAPFDGTQAVAQSALATATPVPATPVPLPTPTASLPSVGNPLETLYIDIAPDDFAIIEAKREEALEKWILQTSSDDFVPASLRLGNGEPLPVRLRLKGDWADHFAHAKWSYRIETRGEGCLWGMRVFSLQDPSTRTYLNEWLFMEALRAEGVLAVGYRFVQGVQNGQALGIYAVEEGFAKELLESQSRREGVIVRYNEDLLWEFWAAYTDDSATPRGVTEFHIVDEFESGKVASTPALAAQRDAAVGRLRAWQNGELAASEVFDVETLAKFFALSDVWGAEHALYWHNLRFYYNPVTTRLEPIAFDTQALGAGSFVDPPALRGLREVLAYDDPRFYRAYTQYLWQYSQPEYLAALRARSEGDFETLRAALEPEFGAQQDANGQSVLTPPWEALSVRQTSLRELLSPLQTVYAYVPAETPEGTLWLDAGNLLDFPVELLGVQAGDTWLPANRAWAGDANWLSGTGAPVLAPLPRDTTFMPYKRLTVPLAVTGTRTLPDLSLVTRVWGLTQTLTRPILIDYPPAADGALPDAPSLAEALAQHAYLSVMPGEEQMLTIAPGTWTISGNLVLPESYGLRLEPGTTLQFAPETFLLARGPLVFDGSEDAPVILQPVGETWWGVTVLEAGAPSFWNYVTARDTHAITFPGWTLTGGITFYRSPIRLDHSHLLGTQAEDGINVIRARFEFVDSEFADTASDAFDSDFGQGLIERCVFHNTGADAIDVSGTEVQVRDVTMYDLGDKGISVGEISRVTAERVAITNADFGVASKDLSQATLSEMTIDGARIAGLAAYIKKPSYGPAIIVAENVTFLNIPDEQRLLIQTGSRLDLDGVRIWGTDVDIDALYEKWSK